MTARDVSATSKRRYNKRVVPSVERPVRTTREKALIRLDTSALTAVNNKFSYLYIAAIAKLDSDSALKFATVSTITHRTKNTYESDLNKPNPQSIKEAFA